MTVNWDWREVAIDRKKKLSQNENKVGKRYSGVLIIIPIEIYSTRIKMF
jgi:hypothetical protein